MRGHYEESDEVKAVRALREAARAHAADALLFKDGDATLEKLCAAAIAYAETQKPRRSARTRNT